MDNELTELMQGSPKAIDRLGETCFEAMQAFELEYSGAAIVYLCFDLLKDSGGRPFNREKLKGAIEKNLFLTLEHGRQKRGSEPVRVMVDRQADPMNMSLNGNLGSGRAVYRGQIFNLKGIGKTIFATSSDPNHSNGRLDLVSALWEAICANVIHTNLETGTAPVLAVVSTGEKIRVPWREGLFSGGFIVRVDFNGELDRPTHLFFRNEHVSEGELDDLAQSLGRQDAEKFIECILHGCWSAGNVSMRGHMIDYDTVFALRSRAPQWSYRPNWLSNFFGLEGDGQKKLLKAIVNQPVNENRLDCRKAYRQFDQARKQHLRKRFFDLLGMNSQNPYTSKEISHDEFDEMVDLFEELSMKMFDDFAATAPWSERSQSLNVLDFSKFLRLAPILMTDDSLDNEAALKLLRNPLARPAESKVAGMPQSIEEILRKKFVVSSDEELEQVEQKAIRFIALYRALLQDFRTNCPLDWNSLILKAFVVNEERTYMNCRPGNDTLVALVQRLEKGLLDSSAFSLRMQTLIMSCDRRLIKRLDKGVFSQTRLFENGFTALLVNEKVSFQPVLTLFVDAVASELKKAEWTVAIAGKQVACNVQAAEEVFNIIGPELPLKLVVSASESGEFAYFCDGRRFELDGLVRLNSD